MGVCHVCWEHPQASDPGMGHFRHWDPCASATARRTLISAILRLGLLLPLPVSLGLATMHRLVALISTIVAVVRKAVGIALSLRPALRLLPPCCSLALPFPFAGSWTCRFHEPCPSPRPTACTSSHLPSPSSSARELRWPRLVAHLLGVIPDGGLDLGVQVEAIRPDNEVFVKLGRAHVHDDCPLRAVNHGLRPGRIFLAPDHVFQIIDEERDVSNLALLRLNDPAHQVEVGLHRCPFSPGMLPAMGRASVRASALLRQARIHLLPEPLGAEDTICVWGDGRCQRFPRLGSFKEGLELVVVCAGR